MSIPLKTVATASMPGGLRKPKSPPAVYCKEVGHTALWRNLYGLRRAITPQRWAALWRSMALRISALGQFSLKA